MKLISGKSLKIILLIIMLVFLNIANADRLTVGEDKNQHYENLIERTDSVKIFYIKHNENFSCKVEVTLGNMKWVSPEKKISKEILNKASLLNCLSREKTKQILYQTYVEFGQGL